MFLLMQQDSRGINLHLSQLLTTVVSMTTKIEVNVANVSLTSQDESS